MVDNSVTPCATPVSMVQAISRATTETSTMPLSMEASMFPGQTSSQTIVIGLEFVKELSSLMFEAILQFGSQLTNNLISMAEQYRLDAMHREELLDQEAMKREKIAAAREKEQQERTAKKRANANASKTRVRRKKC